MTYTTEPYYGVQPRRSGTRTPVIDALTFLIPATIFLKFSLIGTLFVSDFLVVLVLPFIALSRRVEMEPIAKKILILGVVWFFGQVLSDILNQTPFEDYARGWFRILTTLLTLIVLLHLVRDQERRIYIMLAGLAIGIAIDPLVVNSGWPLQLLWKFGLGSGVVLAALLLMNRFYSRRQRAAIFLLFIMAVVSFLLNARSIGGVLFISAVFAAISMQSLRLAHMRPARKALRLVPVPIVLALAAGLLLQSYQYLASEGYLGQDALAKYRMQIGDSSNPVSTLFICGRSEFLISLDAISDSPLFGHGSWAKDPQYRRQMFEEKLAAGCEVSEYFLESSDLIPTHSILFGTWVEAGILGALFWFYVIWLVLRGLVTSFGTRAIPISIFSFLVFWLSWDIVFSPFGGTRRIIVPVMLCACIKLISVVEEQKWKSSKPLRRPLAAYDSG